MTDKTPPEHRAFPVDPYDTTEGLFNHPEHGPETPEQAADRLNRMAEAEREERLGLGSEESRSARKQREAAQIGPDAIELIAIPAIPAIPEPPQNDENDDAAIVADINERAAAQGWPDTITTPADMLKDAYAEAFTEPAPEEITFDAPKNIDFDTGEILPIELIAELGLVTPELPGMPDRPLYNGDPITSLSLKLKTAQFADSMDLIDDYPIGRELRATITLTVTGHHHDTKKDTGELHRTITCEINRLDT